MIKCCLIFSIAYMMLVFFRVDYVDSLGRSRRCAKEDLPMMKKIDEELTGKKLDILSIMKH